MFLEEIYGMLSWGFGFVMIIQFIFIVCLWIYRKFDKVSFVYILVHIILFSFAGYNLLRAINTFEYNTGMGSEEASLSIAIAGLCWAISVLFLLISLSRLVSKNRSLVN
jgi:hypothetical protein